MMIKIVNPCKNMSVKITFKSGELSLCGKTGESLGQCIETVRHGEPAENWTPEMIKKLCDLWDEWHLNHMCPDCEHQRADKQFQKQKHEKVIVYKWLHLKDELRKEKEKVSEYIKKELLENGTVTLTERQRFLYNLENCIYNHVGDYDKTIYKHDENDIEYQTLNWIRVDQYEKGLLLKPCPICGYKYGSDWLKREVPQDVIDWLFNLPD